MQKNKVFSFNRKLIIMIRHYAFALFLLCVSFANLQAAPVSAQTMLDKKVTIKVKEIPLNQVFEKLENLGGVSFTYLGNSTITANKISITARDTKISDILKKILQPLGLSYVVVDEKVIVRYNDTKSTTIAQPSVVSPATSSEKSTAPTEINVSGVVKNTKGDPIKGASVQIKGTQKGVTTNEKGEFELKGVKEGATLVISIVGYKALEIKAKANLVIELTDLAVTLDDVVVTGFQKIDRKKFTGSAVTLKVDSIKIDGVTDISRLLEGRAAGVSIQNVSGTFGSAPKIHIRGATSISGSNKPLWVIDGVVLEDVVNVSNEQLSTGDASTLLGSSVAGLNANDIETFDILKDASAAALYGARAMNGVIVITTKKGKIGKPVIAYTGNYGVQLKPSYANYDIMSSADMMSVYAEIERKGYINFPDMVNAKNSGLFGKLAKLLQTPDANGNFAVQNTTAARQAWLMQYANTNTDWFDILFRNSLTQDHTLSISTGTDKLKSYFSTSFFNDAGWTIADRVQRYTANLNNLYTISNKLSFGFGLNGSVRQQTSPGTQDRTSDPVQGIYSRNFDINPFSYALNSSRALPAYNSDGSLDYFTKNYAPFNIIHESQTNNTKTGIIDLTLKGNFSYKISPHLSYDFTGSLRYVKTTQEHNVLENSNQAQAYRVGDANVWDGSTSIQNDANPFLYRDPTNSSLPKVSVLPYGGFYERYDRTLTNYTVRNQLTYINTWGEGRAHQLTALAGQEVRYVNRQTSNYLGVGYQYGNGGVPYNYYLYFKQMNEQNSNYYGLVNEYDRSVAFYTNATYTYNNKYTLMATLREDGSNQLGLSAKTRWLPTWTLASLWNVDQEKFMENSKVFSHLMLKLSYGLNASVGNANNSTAILRSTTTNRLYQADQQPSIYIDQLQNADLTWEKAYTLNVTADMGFFKDRLIIVPEYYNRHSFSLIGQITTSGIGGQVNQYANYANLNSHGIDVSITGKILAKKNYSYTSTFNMGWGVSTITNQQNTPAIWELVSETGGALQGYPVRGLFSLKNGGLDPTAGYSRFVNEKGEISPAVNLKSLTSQYLQYEGPTDPTFTGGWFNSFNYKQFSLNVLLTFQAGNKVRLTPAYSSSYSDLSSLPNEFKRRFTLPGDDKLTNIPSIADLFTNYGNTGLANIPAYPYSNYNWSHDRVADGGFVRMKSVTLSYQLPNNFISHIGFKTASFSVTANNLWLIYSDSHLHGQDPEFFNTGGVALPINKQITGSLKISL